MSFVSFGASVRSVRTLTQTILTSFLALVFIHSQAFADVGASDLGAVDLSTDSTPEKNDNHPAITHEVFTEYSYVSPGDMEIDEGADLGAIEEHYNRFNYVASIPLAYGAYLRAGLDYERYSFGSLNGAPLPNTLQSTAAVIGFDYEISDQWLMRFEVTPGIYSDFQDITFDDVNAPAVVAFTYLIDSDLQWVFGVSANARREDPFPVVPFVGVRWAFADQWVLNFIPPKPRLEYLYNDALTLFVGADIKGGTYQVAEDLGTTTMGTSALNNQTVDYSEFRVGGGINYRISQWLTAELDGGYLMSRDFIFDRPNINVESDGGAGYIQIGLKGSF